MSSTSPSVLTCIVTQYPVGNGAHHRRERTGGRSSPRDWARSFESDEFAGGAGARDGHVLADHVTFMTTFELVQLVMNGVLRGARFAGLPLKAL